MDSKSKQTLKIVSVFLVLAFFIIGSTFFKIGRERQTSQKQYDELSVIYPEIGEGLKENIDHYVSEDTKTDIVVATASILTIAFSLILLRIWTIKEEKKQNKENETALDLIHEQLIRIQSGENCSDLSTEETGRLSDVYDRLNGFGYYISDLKERLENEENSTKSLITDISHQLKTPLASIRMSHELSQATELTDEERQTFIEAEAEEISRMELLLDELVRLSRLETGMIEIRPVPGSIKDTISEAVSRIYTQAASKKIDIGVDISNDVQISHDRKWTVESLVNILDNAIKYSPVGSSVDISLNILQSYVLIIIEDQGIGISEGEVHEIFKRFYRGSNVRSEYKDGVGVGLYLARNIIERQGGSVTAKRKRDGGSAFQIMMPL